MCPDIRFESKVEEKKETYKIFAIEGQDVDRYIEWFLSECSDISKAILKLRNIKASKKYTCWRASTEKFTYDLLRGGVSEPVGSAPDDWGMVKIFDYLVSKPNGVAVFEDTMFKPDNNVIRDPGVPLAMREDHVFYWIDHDRCSFRSIEKAYDNVESGFRANCILTSFDRKLEGNLDVLTGADIELLAKNTEQIIISAYDFVGCIQVCFGTC